jgi:hypothetical protein
MNVFIIALYLFSLFLPQELSFFVGSIRLELYRVVLLFMFFPAVISVMRSGFLRFEYFLLLYVLWAASSFVIHGGTSGIEPAGVVILEVLASYFVGRSFIGRYGSVGFEKCMKIFAIFLIVMIPFAIIEAVTGFKILHVMASAISGQYTPSYVEGKYLRNGVYRASTVFGHPILYAILAASVFVIFLGLYRKRKSLLIGPVVAVYTSMSSVGFIMVFIQVFILFLARVFRKHPFTKQLSAYGLILLVLVIQFGSNRGFFTWVAMNSALSPWNAYIRLLQWEHAWDDILRSPLIGIGSGDWTRPGWLPGSIDAYWLVVALVNGLPAVIFLILFWVFLLRSVISKLTLTKNLVFLWFIAVIVSIAFAGTTVHFFDKAPALIYFILGVFSGMLMLENSKLKNFSDYS